MINRFMLCFDDEKLGIRKSVFSMVNDCFHLFPFLKVLGFHLSYLAPAVSVSRLQLDHHTIWAKYCIQVM
jgi:hypothetical protein